MQPICSSCSIELSSTDQEECPECGSTGRTLRVRVEDRINVKESGTIGSQQEFYEENRLAKYIIIGVTVGAPLLGLAITGLPGLIVGSILGGLSYFLSPYAITKVREINRSSF